MKTLLNYLLNKQWILYIVMCFLSVGCKTEKVSESETFPLTQEQIMVIFESGYKNGALNGLKNGFVLMKIIGSIVANGWRYG